MGFHRRHRHFSALAFSRDVNSTFRDTHRARGSQVAGDPVSDQFIAWHGWQLIFPFLPRRGLLTFKQIDCLHLPGRSSFAISRR